MPASQDEATNSTGQPVVELLLPHAGCNVRVSRIGIGSMGAVEHYLGLLAATMGHLDGAVRHFEAAMRLNVRMGAACYLANSRYQYAGVLPCDHELSDDHMGRAIASATALGIELQLRRPDASREAAQPEPSMAPSARKASTGPSAARVMSSGLGRASGLPTWSA
jgi:hypothetical protein